MVQITAAMVKELRERTGVGMMDCKKALTAANGDINAAIEALRKAGQAKAVKKGARLATEGLVDIVVSQDGKQVAMVEVNCETDFVAREVKFKDFVKRVASVALQNKTADLSQLQDIEQQRLELVAQLGENISIRKVYYDEITSGVIGSYLHGGSDAARIGAVAICSDSYDINIAKELAMHIAAMNPEYLDQSSIPNERIEHEQAIFLAQAKEINAGKPDNVLEKIVTAKLQKFIKDITLLGQIFVKDPKKTVAAWLQEHNAKVTRYMRYEVGAGLEKKADDFVSEVMSQVQGD